MPTGSPNRLELDPDKPLNPITAVISHFDPELNKWIADSCLYDSCGVGSTKVEAEANLWDKSQEVPEKKGRGRHGTKRIRTTVKLSPNASFYLGRLSAQLKIDRSTVINHLIYLGHRSWINAWWQSQTLMRPMSEDEIKALEWEKRVQNYLERQKMLNSAEPISVARRQFWEDQDAQATEAAKTIREAQDEATRQLAEEAEARHQELKEKLLAVEREAQERLKLRDHQYDPVAEQHDWRKDY